MQLETYNFKGKFRSLIKGIWIIDFLKEDKLNLEDIILPTGFIDIIFSYREDYYLINKDKIKIPKILIAGQSDHALNIQYGDNTKLVGMLVTPIGFQSMFNVSSAPTKNTIIDGSEFKWHLTALFNKLEPIEDLEMMSFPIQEYYKDIEYKKIDRLNTILKMIEDSHGEINIKKLAEKCHLSESAFLRYFKKNTGITPKAYSNIVKFKNSLRNDDINLTNSYYDQSHFIKYCKRYTGKTPKEFLESSNEITLDYILENAEFLQYFDFDSEYSSS